jgi:DNA excision repair protein ERCC-2
MESVLRAIRRHLRENPGNNLIYCPSFAYLDQLHQKLTALKIPSFAQRTGMAESERELFLAKFTKGTGSVGLGVLGGADRRSRRQPDNETL